MSNYTCDIASFPGPAQLSVACSIASDGTATNGKLGGAWERGYL